jgi:hypothetical protein
LRFNRRNHHNKGLLRWQITVIDFFSSSYNSNIYVNFVRFKNKN